jgi:hypothetical protein
VKEGDLVKVNRNNSLAIVVDVYPDLCIEDPWVRIYQLDLDSSYGKGVGEGTYQWIKMRGLTKTRPPVA